MFVPALGRWCKIVRTLIRLVKYKHVFSQLLAEGGGRKDAALEAGSADPGMR